MQQFCSVGVFCSDLYLSNLSQCCLKMTESKSLVMCAQAPFTPFVSKMQLLYIVCQDKNLTLQVANQIAPLKSHSQQEAIRAIKKLRLANVNIPEASEFISAQLAIATLAASICTLRRRSTVFITVTCIDSCF